MVAKNGNNPVGELIVGKAIGAGTMVRVPGKDDIWQAARRDPLHLRQGRRRLARQEHHDLHRRRRREDRHQEQDRRHDLAHEGRKDDGREEEGDKAPAGGDDWTVVASSVPIPKLDPSVASSLISALATWKTNDFADSVKPDVTGLADPALTVTVTLKGGKTVTALIGNKKGDDDFYVKNGESPQVFVVKKWSVEHINKRPIEFRDKTICDIADSDLTEIAVTHGAESYTLTKSGKDWKATKPAKTGDRQQQGHADRQRVQGLEGDRLRRGSVAQGRRAGEAAGGDRRQVEGARPAR